MTIMNEGPKSIHFKMFKSKNDEKQHQKINKLFNAVQNHAINARITNEVKQPQSAGYASLYLKNIEIT